MAQQVPPDFSSNNIAWVSAGDLAAVPGSPPIMRNDPAHRYVPNNTAEQPTYRIGDVSNPNLKPWVRERMKKDNDEVLAGKIAFTARQSCMPAGVPGFHLCGFRAGPFRPDAPEVLSFIRATNRSGTSISTCPIRLSRSRPGMGSRSAIMRATRWSSTRSE